MFVHIGLSYLYKYNSKCHHYQFLGDSVEFSSHHLCPFGRENTTKCKHVALLISHMQHHHWVHGAKFEVRAYRVKYCSCWQRVKMSWNCLQLCGCSKLGNLWTVCMVPSIVQASIHTDKLYPIWCRVGQSFQFSPTVAGWCYPACECLPLSECWPLLYQDNGDDHWGVWIWQHFWPQQWQQSIVDLLPRSGLHPLDCVPHCHAHLGDKPAGEGRDDCTPNILFLHYLAKPFSNSTVHYNKFCTSFLHRWVWQ